MDQEKAYDKIRHDYLWKTLEAFNLPETFTKTIKALYQNARTQVAINGMLSDPYKITRGIRQGDPQQNYEGSTVSTRPRTEPSRLSRLLPNLAESSLVWHVADVSPWRLPRQSLTTTPLDSPLRLPSLLASGKCKLTYLVLMCLEIFFKSLLRQKVVRHFK